MAGRFHFRAPAETVFVDRERRRTIPGTNAAMAQRMLGGRPMKLFPEATTGDVWRFASFIARISPPRVIFSPQRARSRRSSCSLSRSAIQRPRRHGSAMRPYCRTFRPFSRASRSGAISPLASRGRGENRKVHRQAGRIRHRLNARVHARAAEPDLAERAEMPALDPLAVNP
jgi:1-acyl-sn-glycerol-3-phosphate acyltransferase